MNQVALIRGLVAVAAIAVVAVLVLVIRNRGLGERKWQAESEKRQVEAELARQRDEALRRLRIAEADLEKFQEEQLAVISETEHVSEERTKAVLKGAARSLQTLATELMPVLGGIQHKYGGHPVLTDLLEAHHVTAQMARKAEGIAVMCGAPLGRRKEPASVYDVVRNAQSQIRNFQRVQIMQVSGIALKASAVAPVAVSIAELLDNAATFTPPDAPIEVTFQRVQKNICIVIDDAGVGMNDEDRQAAMALLDGDTEPPLSQLGSHPKFGFPVIARLARQYGFRVDVTGVSRYGGVRAVVLLPEDLWTEEEAPPLARNAGVSNIRRTEGGPWVAGRTDNGLPRRRGRQTPTAKATGTGAAGDTPGTPDGAGRRVGRSLAGLQRGTTQGRNSAPSPKGSEDV